MRSDDIDQLLNDFRDASVLLGEYEPYEDGHKLANSEVIALRKQLSDAFDAERDRAERAEARAAEQMACAAKAAKKLAGVRAALQSEAIYYADTLEKAILKALRVDG